MRVWVVACLMSLVAMSGCVTDAEQEPTNSECTGADCDTAPADSSGDTGQSEPEGDGSEPESVSNEGAEATLSASNETGEAPFDVVFDYDVVGAVHDEALAWTLDANGDGTVDTEGNGISLPGNFTFSFTAEGDYTATFNATDGEFSWNASVAIQVTKPAEEEPPAEEEEEQEPPFGGIDEGVFTPISCGVACTDARPTTACLGLANGENGLDCAWVEIPESAWGLAFTITSDFADPDPDAAALTSCSADAEEIEGYGEFGGESGVIPKGTGCLVGWEWVGAAVTITFHVDAA